MSGIDSDAPSASITRATVLVIGAGFSGLGAAIQLLSAGVRDVLVLERAESVGGTWRDNTYPGCACDIPSHLYSFSFHLNPDWSHHYSKQPEIQAYLERIRTEYQLDRHLRMGVDCVRAEFSERRGCWTVHARDGRRFEARFLIGGLGPLRIPRYPDIPGRERFAGPQMHSARWDASVDLSGRRVGVVGSGASAVQIVPEIADTVGQLHVFQRTPPWVAPRMDGPIAPRTRALLRSMPWLMWIWRGLLYTRFELYYLTAFGGMDITRRLVRALFTRHIVRSMGSADAAHPLIPTYAPGCKRILSSTAWYPTLRRSDVSLHPMAVAEVDEKGVVLADGRSVPLDVLVWCTGFVVDQPLGQLDVIGRGGVSLRDQWGLRPRAHLGVTVPEFPNLFLLLGPNSGLGHNSVVLMIEAQVRYVVRAIQCAMGRGAAVSVEVKPEAEAAFVEELDRKQKSKVWAAGCSSWYLNDAGENFSIWPGTTLAYFWRMARFDLEHYALVEAGAPD